MRKTKFVPRKNSDKKAVVLLKTFFRDRNKKIMVRRLKITATRLA